MLSGKQRWTHENEVDCTSVRPPGRAGSRAQAVPGAPEGNRVAGGSLEGALPPRLEANPGELRVSEEGEGPEKDRLISWPVMPTP